MTTNNGEIDVHTLSPKLEIPWEKLNWILTFLLPIIAVAVTWGTVGTRLQSVEKFTEEQRVYHHISREEVSDLIAHDGPYVADRSDLHSTLNTLKDIQTQQATQIINLRTDLSAAQVRQERIETKLDLILGEVRHGSVPKVNP